MPNQKYVDYQRICEDRHTLPDRTKRLEQREWQCGLIFLLTPLAAVMILLFLGWLFAPQINEQLGRGIGLLILKVLGAVSKAVPN
jgi:hypothetical protein